MPTKSQVRARLRGEVISLSALLMPSKKIEILHAIMLHCKLPHVLILSECNLGTALEAFVKT